MRDTPCPSNQSLRVCLFEDRGALSLEPLTLTRPVFELLCGRTSLATKQRRCFPDGIPGALLRSHLCDVYRQLHPDVVVNDLGWLRAAPTALVNGRWLPPANFTADTTEAHVALVGDEVAYAVVGPEHLAECESDTVDDSLERWKQALPCRTVGGRLVRRLWELVDRNVEQLELDGAPRQTHLPSLGQVAVVGPAGRLFVHPTARVDPMVVADTTKGTVVIEREAVVTAFTRLEGPCHIGPSTQLHGAKVRGGTTFGPHCRIGGEVEASIVQGYSNKYHDGFLGHAYVGEWVNLGAGTSNSDLRNDYGEVRVVVQGDLTPSGLSKVGCFLGDHVKAGLGTLLNTGTNVGVFANLLPSGGFVPKYVPSFCSWWNGAIADRAELSALLRTAAEVTSRRGRVFTDADAALARYIFERSAGERRRALRDAEQRRLRRSA